MSDEITQKVTILVTEGGKTAKFEVERIHAWPNSKPPHITHLIDSVAQQAKSVIWESEGGKHSQGAMRSEVLGLLDTFED